MNLMTYRLLFASLAVGSVALACSSTSATPQAGSGTGSGTSSGDPVVTAEECASTCEAKATGCGATAADASARCSPICGGQPTEAQMACLSAKSCGALAKVGSAAELDALCKKGPASSSGGSSGNGSSGNGSSGNGSSGNGGKPPSKPPAACIPIGGGGCDTLNAPSGCCTDAKRTSVVCNGNNGGVGVHQCCVNAGKPCVTVSDCCGYAGASAAAKAQYKCDGVCSF